MKKITRVFLIVMAFTMLLSTLALTSLAKKNHVTEYQESVVLIQAAFNYHSTNYSASINDFSVVGTGTGFAIGKKGKPVEYIGTASHVINENSGMYGAYCVQTNNGFEVIDIEALPEGTESSVQDATYNGIPCVYVIDHFEVKNIDTAAIFSAATNEFSKLTVVAFNDEVDVAVCKLPKPTEHLKSIPLQFKDNIKPGDSIYAIGYASTSKVVDDIGDYSHSDSTVKSGVISRIQTTYGLNGSKTPYNAFEVDAELITGMSGGPIISEKSGAVIGITAHGITDISQAASANIAVCADYLISLLDANRIEYQLASATNIVTIAIIAGAAIALIAIIVLVIVLISKNKKPAVSTPVGAGVATPRPTSVAKCHVICLSGPLADRKFGVVDRAIIGRDKTACNIVFPINQPGVSGVHCEIKISGGAITLKDCGSSYGTFLINGTKLNPNEPVILENGSRFYVGTNENVFEVRI